MGNLLNLEFLEESPSSCANWRRTQRGGAAIRHRNRRHRGGRPAEKRAEIRLNNIALHCRKAVLEEHLCLSLDESGKIILVITVHQREMRQHLLQYADVERMIRLVPMMAMPAGIVVSETNGMFGARLITMATQLGLKDQPHPIGTIMMVMRHNGMQHDDRACQRDHYFRRNIPHTVMFAMILHTQRQHLLRCKDMKKIRMQKKNLTLQKQSRLCLPYPASSQSLIYKVCYMRRHRVPTDI